MLVTGASRRIAIGAAIARRLVADGARVMLHSWSPHDAEQPWGADPGGPEAVIDATHRAFGRLDVVVANHARSSSQSLEQLTAAEVDLSHAVNVRTTLLLI